MCHGPARRPRVRATLSTRALRANESSCQGDGSSCPWNYYALYAFRSQPGCTDGAQPMARLIAVNGSLYGTTISSGA